LIRRGKGGGCGVRGFTGRWGEVEVVVDVGEGEGEGEVDVDVEVISILAWTIACVGGYGDWVVTMGFSIAARYSSLHA